MEDLFRVPEGYRCATNQVRSKTYLFPWANHVFDVNWNGIATQVARAKVVAFLQKHG